VPLVIEPVMNTLRNRIGEALRSKAALAWAASRRDGRTLAMRVLQALLVAACLVATASAQDGGKRWATAVATRPSDGHKMIYRYIEEFELGFDRHAFPERVTLEWPYRSDTGLPSPSDRQAMDRFEDLLSAKLQSRGPLSASLVVVSTGEGLRRWTYYVKSAEAFSADFSSVSALDRVPVESHAEHDPGWISYEAFVRSVRH
jgi:hypothetical protein